MSSEPDKERCAERDPIRPRPDKAAGDDADEGRLDLGLIVLQAVHKGFATDSALAEYCRGADGDSCSTPADLGPVLQELTEDDLLEVTAIEDQSRQGGPERAYALTLLGRTVLDLE